MATEVILPKVDMDMEAGTVSAWHAAPGASVTEGDALFDIETDKSAMEVEAPATGILAHVVAKVGARIPVGEPVAWLYAEGEAIPDAPPVTAEASAPGPAPSPTAAETEAAPMETAATAPADTARTGDGIRATPAARRAAREAGLTLGQIAGSGPKGRIQVEDVTGSAGARRSGPHPATAPAVLHWEEDPGPLAVTRRKGQGEGAPIVLIHGFAADAAGWTPLEKALGTARDIIRIDLASHGRSPLKRVEGFPDFARHVVNAFDDLALEQAHLVGHSLGGAVAATVADIRPRRVRSLALIAPAGLGPEIDGAVLNGIARATRSDSLAPWLKRLAADPASISHDFAKAAMLSRMDGRMRMAQVDLADRLFPDGTQSFDLRPALDRIEVPLRILWGRQDSILPWRQVLHAPDTATLQLLDNAGHIPHIERPEACAKALHDHFLVSEA